ncbi:hypothetical protein [Paracoccus sp. (in: a-proteobacteria)]|uniref:hypothetical protein n=1 Tax=Paracoccus sp. TaxID=267 RepID=UPI0026DEC347|nr:hypothetical protein [Paracoccus sp. (in: a-proteobacteria)]MDO5371487.1 hypothetical protein [Paracoccus sp. (in: a-proteobacteria)]
MRKGLIALALFGGLFVALMVLAPRPQGGDAPPRWTEALGRLLGGFAPRVRSLDGETAFTLAPGAVLDAEVPAAPGKDLRLLTLRHGEGGAALVTFACRPIPADETCDGEEEEACLGLPLHPACEAQIDKGDRGKEISFTVGPGGGRIAIAAGETALRVEVMQ